MKAWEKHLVDQYLLANDILENLYYQRHGYKGAFYYAFNHNLKFLQSDGSYNAQLKLLALLADRGILEYSIKAPGQYVTDDFFSRNVTDWKEHKKLIHIRVKPHKFNEVYAELLRYQPEEEKQTTAHADLTLRLIKSDNRLALRIGDQVYTLSELRPELPPDRIFTALINRWPNTRVTRTMLETEAGIKTKRPLNQIINKSLGPIATNLFVPVRTPEALQVKPEVVADRYTVELLLSELGQSI
jgi:hypothetical protein